jgi:Ca2+-binding EF-hand superfamily protein
MRSDRVTSPVIDFRSRKLINLFDVLDTEQRGVVTEADCLTLGQELSDALDGIRGSVPAGDLGPATAAVDTSLQAAELSGTIKEIWNEYRRRDDVKDHDRLTVDDFVTAMLDDFAVRPDKVIRFIGILTNLIFELADADGDGKVSRNELIELGVRVPRLRDGAMRARDTMDASENGHMTYEQLLAVTTSYVTSVDPSAPENQVLGPL